MIAFRVLCVLGLTLMAVALPVPEGTAYLVFRRGHEDLVHAANLHDKSATASDDAVIAAALNNHPHHVVEHYSGQADTHREYSQGLREATGVPHLKAVAVGTEQSIIAVDARKAAAKDAAHYWAEPKKDHK